MCHALLRGEGGPAAQLNCIGRVPISLVSDACPMRNPRRAGHRDPWTRLTRFSSCWWSSFSSCRPSSLSRNEIAPMSQGPIRRLPSWSLLKHTALFPASIAWLVDSRGKCPLPGVPLSVKVPKPGSPVRSLGCRVMAHPASGRRSGCCRVK